MSTSKRIAYLDLLNVLAIFCVVLLHVAECFLLDSGLSAVQWWPGMVYDAACRFSVPVFLMCSGAVFLNSDKVDAISKFYRRRLPKFVIPLVGWSLLYYGYSCWTSSDLIWGPSDFLRRLAGSRVEGHLWFSYLIICVYLAIPYLYTLFRQAEPARYAWFLVCAFGINSVNHLLGYFFDAAFYYPPTMFAAFLGYFVLGGVLARARLLGLAGIGIGLAGWLLGSTVTLWGSWVLKQRKALDPYLFLRYETLPNVVAAAGIFWLVRSLLPTQLGQRESWLSRLAATSYGVYLCHQLVRKVLASQGWSYVAFGQALGSSLAGIAANALLVYIVSIYLAIWLSRIPLLRRLVS